MTPDLKRPIVCLITEGDATAENFDKSSEKILAIIRIAVEEAVPLVQIREKQLNAKLLFDLTRAVSDIVRGTAAPGQHRTADRDRADDGGRNGEPHASTHHHSGDEHDAEASEQAQQDRGGGEP